MTSLMNFTDTSNKRRRESSRDESVNVNSYENPYQKVANKENHYLGMEVKSIAQMIADKTIENPFEVTRKPPKKKKKADIEDSCFVNPALNLNGPEIMLNPFEIKRLPTPVQDDLCFVNSGLNIRVTDKDRDNSSAFEISRGGGIENLGLDLKLSTPRAIAVPFTPNMGCRINFNDIPLDSLTPCSMLTNKLVLTSPNSSITPKRSIKATSELSVISEEVLNIGEELDCYQLELENSINEAKADKKQQTNGKNLIDLKNKTKFARRLELSEESVEHFDETKAASPLTPKTNPIDKTDNSDVIFEEINETSDDEFEFKNPAPFVRTYRRSARKPSNLTVKPRETNIDEPKDKTSSFRRSIRKSIRKLLSSHSDIECKAATSQPTGSIFTTLRQSLRRRPGTGKTSLIDANCESQHNVSVLMDIDRKVFKQIPSERQNDNAFKDDGRKTSLRSSFRNTTKDVRRQVMRSVFKKNVEDYCL